MNIPWEAIIALAIYIIGSTVGFVWWMATQTITLQFVREDLSKANRMLLNFEATYITRVEVAKDIGRIENAVNSAHARIDKWTK